MNETRRFVIGAELRAKSDGAGDDSLIVQARIVKYGALSLPGVPVAGGRERIAAGAFRDSLANGDDVVGLYNHNQSAPLGRVSNGRLKLTDSPDALNATFCLNPAVVAHRDLYQLVKDGTVKDCSFAFSQPEDDWSDEKDERGKPYTLRTVKRAKLHDCSLVLSPAYGNGATSAEARSLAYRFTRTRDPWAAERAVLAAIDAKFEGDLRGGPMTADEIAYYRSEFAKRMK